MMGMGSGDRLRTVWTPEMDRYFIDLMLEQATKGNRFDDQSFSKRAWRNMVSSFNDRFRFQYEKDVLKNRHKTLRNLYKAVTTLLDQPGFSWDDTKQMVAAHDHVWDRYIKSHRDVRSFQTKTIPYYTDLCLIYKDVPSPDQRGETIRGEESRAPALQQVSVDDDDIIIDGEDYKVNVVGNDFMKSFEFCRRSRIYWKPPMDRYFIDLMLKQVEEGGRVDRVFRKQAWMEMISSFNSKFGFVNSSDILKNRYKTLRKQYNIIRNLLEIKGFVWDDSREMVTASDNVWQDYIKAHSDARQFMTRPIPYFKDLCKICDPSLDEKEGPCSQDSGKKEGFTSEMEKNSEPDFECLSHSKRPRWNNNEEVVPSLSEKNNDTKESSAVTIESVVEAVQALPDMDEDFVLDACDLLEDENKARTFMALDVKLRRKWLVRKLRPHTLISNF